jgi:hypothetical protein
VVHPTLKTNCIVYGLLLPMMQPVKHQTFYLHEVPAQNVTVICIKPGDTVHGYKFSSLLTDVKFCSEQTLQYILHISYAFEIPVYKRNQLTTIL